MGSTGDTVRALEAPLPEQVSDVRFSPDGATLMVLRNSAVLLAMRSDNLPPERMVAARERLLQAQA
jgi:hypothetical protein